MDQVTVRAEQAFEDWAVGDVRTIARTPAVDTLISDGRVSVIDLRAPVEPPTPATESAPESEAEEPADPEQVRRRRPRPDKG